MLNQRRLTSKSYHMQRIIARRRRESLDERLRQDYSFVVIQFHPLITYVLLAPFALLVKRRICSANARDCFPGSYAAGVDTRQSVVHQKDEDPCIPRSSVDRIGYPYCPV